MSYPLWQPGRVQTNERHAMNAHQLELTLDSGAAMGPQGRGRVSPDRAAWWFDRIHARLRQAWRPAPPARHEQERFVLGDAGGARWSVATPRWVPPSRVGSEELEHAA